MLVCINCARAVVFVATGWIHRDPATECPGVVVAWPPPRGDDAEDAA